MTRSSTITAFLRVLDYSIQLYIELKYIYLYHLPEKIYKLKLNNSTQDNSLLEILCANILLRNITSFNHEYLLFASDVPSVTSYFSSFFMGYY